MMPLFYIYGYCLPAVKTYLFKSPKGLHLNSSGCKPENQVTNNHSTPSGLLMGFFSKPLVSPKAIRI